MQHLNARIGEADGVRLRFPALRICFITVADREQVLPTSLTKHVANHAPASGRDRRRRRRLDDGVASRERPARRRSYRRADWRSNADSRDLAIDRLTCAEWRNPIPADAIRSSV